MSSILNDEFQNPGIVYEEQSKLKIDENRSFSFWFNPTKRFNNQEEVLYDMVDGTNIMDNGMIIQLSSRKIRIVINKQEYVFEHGIIFSNTEWYAIVVNMSNSYGEVTPFIYKLDSQAKYTNPTGGLELNRIYSGNLDMLSPQTWETDVNWSLRGSEFNLTCFRMFNKTIEEEQHVNVLHQYVVRDAEYAMIIDNAIPSLQVQKIGTGK
jgi:hypothetical protein